MSDCPVCDRPYDEKVRVTGGVERLVAPESKICVYNRGDGQRFLIFHDEEGGEE